VLPESGAITQYLAERYGESMSSVVMAGLSEGGKAKIYMWIHAAEGTFMVHALAITYARCMFFLPFTCEILFNANSRKLPRRRLFREAQTGKSMR
jgi:glutathione S-transferase